VGAGTLRGEPGHPHYARVTGDLCYERSLSASGVPVQGSVPVKGLMCDQPLPVNLEQREKVSEASVATEGQLA
jgi:hypothetical protein